MYGSRVAAACSNKLSARMLFNLLLRRPYVRKGLRDQSYVEHSQWVTMLEKPIEQLYAAQFLRSLMSKAILDGWGKRRAIGGFVIAFREQFYRTAAAQHYKNSWKAKS